MTLREIIQLSSGNLWRQKLRASLTIAGVMIAIASLVAMLSFGAGMQRTVTTQFENLGLLTTMQVYPVSQRANSTAADTLPPPLLDDQALQQFAALPGVRFAFPMRSFAVEATLRDTTLKSKAQPLPSTAFSMKYFSYELSGSSFEHDSSRSVVITSELLKELRGVKLADVIGDTLILRTHAASFDSALQRVILGIGDPIERVGELMVDSLLTPGYLGRLLKVELQAGIEHFIEGYITAREAVTETLFVAGVIESERGGRQRTSPIILSPALAKRLDRAGVADDPAELMQALQSGALFESKDSLMVNEYSRATLHIDPAHDPLILKKQIEEMGYRAFSYLEEFKEMRRFFLLFDSALGIVGLVALIVASLGIVNTMVMSILERTAEIGVLKSLGADDRDIRRLFLAESGMIGLAGSLLGLGLGWVIARIASFVAQQIMQHNEMPTFDVFHLPWWLIVVSIVFGLAVSLLAGLYPSSRAAHVDPVQALRGE